MKKLFLFLIIFFASCNIDAVADNVKYPATITKSVVTNTITIEGISYPLVPIPAKEYTDPMDYNQLFSNNPYLVNNGINNPISDCGVYKMRFRAGSSDVVWAFRSANDDFNELYTHANECRNAPRFYLTVDRYPVVTDGSDGHSIATTLINNVYTVNGTYINKSGLTNTINFQIGDFEYPIK